EFLNFYGDIRFPFVAAAFVLVFGFFLFAGEQLRFLKTPLVFPWIALLAWWLLAGAVGIYRARKAQYLIPYALRIHTLPFIFCALAQDTRAVRRLLYGAGYGLIVVLAACAFWGEMSGDRFLIAGTSLGNANDLALRLLLSGSLLLVFW